mmetsp:Transcript_16990/g.23639  ORF Transcript_16990/g.23639 Transcript_16990/m.23639 type:complete len:590 (-) Transcript_16990:206-1975(-)
MDTDHQTQRHSDNNNLESKTKIEIDPNKLHDKTNYDHSEQYDDTSTHSSPSFPPFSIISHPNSPSQRERDPDNEPPHSRVFIVCPKNVVEEQLISLFDPYGQIEYCRIIRDKATKESKGVAYIKFSRTSEAALAIENMNGYEVSNDSPPFKVVVAEAKGKNTNVNKNNTNNGLAVSMNMMKGLNIESSKDDTPPHSRLFILCPKELLEEDIKNRILSLGFTEGFEYCKLVKDKQTGESKGCAYVKFKKASTAALCMEAINQLSNSENSTDSKELLLLKIRAMVADPRSSKRSTELFGRGMMVPMIPMGHVNMMPHSSPMPYLSAPPTPPTSSPSSSSQISFPINQNPFTNMNMMPMQYAYPRQRLYVVVHKSVAYEQLARLFAKFSGMEYCDLKKNKQTGESKGFAYVNYSTPQSAAMAQESLNGIEFPPGHILKVVFAEPLVPSTPVYTQPQPPPMYPPSPTQTMYQQPPLAMIPSTTTQTYTHKHSNSNTTIQYGNSTPTNNDGRLFIVMTGRTLPEYMLHDIFMQFGGLEYVRIQKDKNYGFIKFSNISSALYAMRCMDGADIHGSKLKVTIAQPPPSDSRKRQKT